MRYLAVMMAATLVCAMIVPAQAQPFSDVPTSHWAYDAIAELAAKGLMEGYPDGTFKGDRAMTRYEMAMIVARLLARIESIQIPAPQAPQVTRTDVQSVQRLVNEFRAELAALGVRVTAVEEELNAIKAKLDNVRLGVAFRFRYDIQQQGATGITLNGNPRVSSVDASNSALVPRARMVMKLFADGSVAPDVHLILALVTGGGGSTSTSEGQTYQIFNSSCFGFGTCPGSTTGQYVFGAVDQLFFDWKSAFGWPLEIWLGRFGGGEGLKAGSHPVQFGPFGLLMFSNDNQWKDTTNNSGMQSVDGLLAKLHVAALADLQVQGLIARINGGLGGTSYFSGEDAYGVDANVRVVRGVRLGGYYVANNITNPTGFTGVAPNGTLWHLYGPSSGPSRNPVTSTSVNSSGCMVAGTTGIQCAAMGSGGGGYVQWNVMPGIHFDGEYAVWNDAVHNTNDSGYQVNVGWDLGTMTGVGHRLTLQTGYLNFGQNFYPPYGAVSGDLAMQDSFYPGNEQGVTAQISFDPVPRWTIYGTWYSGNNISNGMSQTEYQAGVAWGFAPQTRIQFYVRDMVLGGVTQFLLYRVQMDLSY